MRVFKELHGSDSEVWTHTHTHTCCFMSAGFLCFYKRFSDDLASLIRAHCPDTPADSSNTTQTEENTHPHKYRILE